MVSPTEAIMPVNKTVAIEGNASTDEVKVKVNTITATLILSAWVLNNLFKAVKGLVVDEFMMVFTRDGLKVNAVDPAHVFMGVHELGRKAFNKYEVSQDFKVGLSKDKLGEILDGPKKTKKNADLIELVINMEKMTMSYVSGFIKGQVALLDAEGLSDPKVPVLNLKSEFKVRVKDILQWMTKKASKISDHVTVSTMEDKVIFHAEGDIVKSTLEMPMDTPLVKYILGESSTTMFSLEYLEGLFKAIDGATEYATIFMGTNYPMRVEYEYNDGDAKGTFLLAPRLENGG